MNVELLTLFWEDHYRQNPIDAKKTETGDVVFNTGDPLIDKWEQELASGLVPDLLEGLPKEQRDKYKRMQEKASVIKEKEDVSLATIDDGFEESYG